MDNLRYLAEYELESHACLEEGLDKVQLNHPSNIYQVELRNKSVELGDEYSLLTAYIIFETDSLDEAKVLSREYMKEYVDLLTFSTNSRFKIRHLMKVADWTKGITERQCYIYNKFPGDERPYPFVGKELIKSIEDLLKADITPLFRRALKWFSNGVSASYMDDQFQYFWFVMELLSQRYKNTEKVNDSCPKCRLPLYCSSCDEHPKHKPYPKQAIKHLFSLMVKDKSDDMFEILNKIRNALMHGDDIKTIEDSLDIDFSEYVNKLGKISWTTIFNTFANSFENGFKSRFHLIQVSSYCSMTLTTNTHILFHSKDPDNPKIDEIPTFEVSMKYQPVKESNNSLNPDNK